MIILDISPSENWNPSMNIMVAFSNLLITTNSLANFFIFYFITPYSANIFK
jgi:hypothetical protein